MEHEFELVEGEGRYFLAGGRRVPAVEVEPPGPNDDGVWGAWIPMGESPLCLWLVVPGRDDGGEGPYVTIDDRTRSTELLFVVDHDERTVVGFDPRNIRDDHDRLMAHIFAGWSQHVATAEELLAVHARLQDYAYGCISEPQT